MTIPNGIKVETWTETYFNGNKMGPYLGPVSLPVVDGGDPTDKSYEIRSMRITSIEPSSNNRAKKKTSKVKRKSKRT